MKLYLAGNFPQLKLPHLERETFNRVMELGIRYERLNSFYYHPDIETVMNIKRLYPNYVGVFLDSGAPTLYNLYSRKHKTSIMGAMMDLRKYDDFTFLHSPEYLQHKANYIEYIKHTKDDLDGYANLDIINNAEETWKNQIDMEGEGLDPVAVWHFGTPEEYLRRYIRRGHEYIAIGGLIPNPPSVLIPNLDRLWKEYLTDDKGMPIVKVHGFAVTSPRIMTRYPWYSVDSTSWVKYGRFGIVCVPRRKDGGYDWNHDLAWHVFVSTRSPKVKDPTARHINHFKDREREAIMGYFEEMGFKLGRSSVKEVSKGYTCRDKEGEAWIDREKGLVEVTEEVGLCNNYKHRDLLNLLYYVHMQHTLPEWPWPYRSDPKPKEILSAEAFQ